MDTVSTDARPYREIRALLEFASQTPEGELLIRERISRQDIAKMVGASREMVSRVMKDLEERGFIETQENGAILVKDRLNALSMPLNYWPLNPIWCTMWSPASISATSENLNKSGIF